jgi:organic hydroperoxide reductase OsmC/OhrA
MSEYEVVTIWSLDGTLEPQKYSTTHTASFGKNLTLPMSATPEFNGSPDCVNPEQALASALSSCHMMTFLALAAKAKWPVTGYSDRAFATVGKLPDGRYKVDAISLNPKVTCSNGIRMKAEELQKMHERAHRYCFVANSLDLAMTINVQEG